MYVAKYFQQALDVTRDQQAKSLELRTSMNRSRMCQQQGKDKDICKEELIKVYGWFSEGFDTYDLHQAKNLANRLS